MVGLDMSWVERSGLIMLNMTSRWFRFFNWLYTRPMSFEILVVDLIVVVHVRSSLLLDNTYKMFDIRSSSKSVEQDAQIKQIAIKQVATGSIITLSSLKTRKV
jgi:hypothetical protein